MRLSIIAIAATIAVVGIAGTASAQSQRSVRATMSDMKAKYGHTFAQCQDLAASRGFRFKHGEHFEDRLVMMFIDGCVMGRQR